MAPAGDLDLGEDVPPPKQYQAVLICGHEAPYTL